ncbi:fluoride export protein [Anaeramoeba flamelloides]|uniref:Fluoride export protein n=1 Tax=Anaeramoeba flamelloides TaxID=1746091 RepID=A0ABQ8Z5T6_9EUKA|nr:fluoride export protein [Anaeramoeba flamelloides]
MSFSDDFSPKKINLMDEDQTNINSLNENPRKKEEIPTIFNRKVSKDAYMNFWRIVWMIVIGSFASFVEFWLPDIFVGVINLSNTLKNGIGAFVIGMVSTIEIIKFQYPQTYLVYNAIGGAFCSVMTTFGNIIEDTESLLYYDHIYPAPIYLIGNLIFSFLLHELGVLIAKKWKSGARFAHTLNSLDNSDQRLMFEMENKGFKSKIEKQKNLDEIESKQQRLIQDPETDRITINKPLLENSEESQEENNTNKKNAIFNEEKLTINEIQEINENQLTNDFDIVGEENAIVYYKDKRMDELSKHVQIQFLKKNEHDTIFLTGRHKFALVIMIFFVISNCFFVKRPLFYPSKVISTQNELEYYYYVMLFLNVFGAFAGGWISGDQNKKFDVQWGTFRNNMVSVILIATAHNILMLQGLFHLNKKIKIFLLSFISDYCGSESNWAGLINETALLYRNKSISKSISLKNLFYTLIFCFIFYVVLIYIVRLFFFFTF